MTSDDHRPESDTGAEPPNDPSQGSNHVPPEDQPTQPQDTQPQDSHPPEQSEQPAPPAQSVLGHVRPAPRYGRFIVAGIFLGLVAAVAITFAVPPSSGLADNQIMSARNTIGVLFLTLGFFGAIIGAFVAYAIDRRSQKRAAQVRDAALRPGVSRAEPPRTEEAKEPPKG